MILIDSRENKRKDYAENFFKEKGETTKIKELPIGDYIYNNKICVEYKTSEDMISSIKDGRVFRQSSRMAQYPYHIIIIKGDVFKTIQELENTRIFGKKKKKDLEVKDNRKYPILYDKEYLGALAKLFIKKENVMMVNSREQAFELMWSIFEKSNETNVPSIDRPEFKLKNPAATYLTCQPRVGKNTALLVTDKLKVNGLNDLLDITHDDLLGIKGIREKKADLIMKAIHGEG